MSTPVLVVLIVAAAFLLLALLVVVRLTLRRSPPSWAGIRVGFFVERDPSGYSETQVYPLKEDR